MPSESQLLFGTLGTDTELGEALPALLPEKNSVSIWALWKLVHPPHYFQAFLCVECLGISHPLVPLLTHLLVQEPFLSPGTIGPVCSQSTDAPC